MSEAVEQMLRRHEIATALRPHKILHQPLVHPKDKRLVQDSSGVVYATPCNDFPMVYIIEYKTHMEQLERVKYTRARRKESFTEFHRLVLKDNVTSENHTINWDGVGYMPSTVTGLPTSS